MARSASIGEMRTRVVVRTMIIGIDPDGFAEFAYTDAFPAPIWCKWVSAHGTEALENARNQMTQTATLTLPYTAKITARSRIWRAEEASEENAAWDVVSVNNVEDKNRTLEVLIRKKVKA